MAWKLFVGGVDKTSSIDQTSRVVITREHNERGTAHFVTVHGYQPADGAEVLIYDTDGTTVLMGCIVMRLRTMGNAQLMKTRVECVDFSWYLGRVTVAGGSLTGVVTLKAVLQWLVTNYLSPYGITLAGGQVDGPSADVTGFQWSRKYASEVLRDLTTYSGGYVWTLSPSKVLEMKLPSLAAPSAPFSVTDTTNNRELEWSLDRSDYATKIIVRAGGTGTRAIVDYPVDVGDLISLTYYETPTASVPAGPVSAKINGVGAGTIGLPGAVGTKFNWDWYEHKLFVGTAYVPTGGDSVLLTYTAQYPFEVSSATGGAPYYEKLVDANDVTTLATAQEIAAGELAKSSAVPRTYELFTLTPGLAPGQVLSINSTYRSAVSTTAMITKVTIELHTNLFWTYKATAVAGVYQGSWLDFFRNMGGGGGSVATAMTPTFTPSSGSTPATITGYPLTKTDDTNITATLGGSHATALVNPASITLGFTGTFAAARLNANVVQSVSNDTNVTGSIGSQNLTLGWAGTLAAARLNANVVQAISNDTNVTGSISAQNLTLAWAGLLSLARGGTNANLTASNGGVVYSTASALAIAAPGAANTILLSSGAGAPAFSTATYLATVTAGNLLVATATNVVGELGAVSAGRVLRSQGVGAVPAYSTATYPATAPTAGAYLRADGTNWITSTLVLPNAVTAGRLAVAIATNTIGELAAGSAGQIVQSAGAGVVPVFTTATYPATAGAAGTFIRSDATNYGNSTLVLPNAATANQLVRATAANTYGGDSNLTFNGTTFALTGGATISTTLGVTGNATFSGAVKHPSYASQTTKWGIDSEGGADFRYLFVDEMHAKVFIADLEQALAGGQIISKSVAMVAQAFTVPSSSGTATLWVRDLPSAANMAAFESGDSVVLRSFSRASGSLTIADAVGVVTAYADGTGGNEGQQSWTFTRNSGGGGGGTIAYVSKAQNFADSGATTIASPAQTHAAGNLLVALINFNDATSITGVADSDGNTWTPVGSVVTLGSSNGHIYYAYNIGGFTNNVVTATFNTTAAFRTITVYEFSGILTTDPIGGSNQATGTGTALSSGTVTVTAASEVILAVGLVLGNPASVGSGYTGSNFNTYFLEEYKTPVSASEAATATQSSAGWFLKAASFKVGAGGGGGNAGSMSGGIVIAVDALALDYGVTGNGYYEVSAVDGIYGANSPYAQIVTWATAPVAANKTVRTRFGKLTGITSTANEYGMIAGTFAASNGAFFRASNTAFDLHGITARWWSGATNVITIAPNGTSPYIGLGNPAPSAFGANVGIFLGWENATSKAKFSCYADANNYVQYDGAKLTWKAANTTLDASGNLTAASATLSGALTATSGSITGDFAIGSGGVLRSVATAYATGTGLWMDYNAGTPRWRVGNPAGNRLTWDGTTLSIVGTSIDIDTGIVDINNDGFRIVPNSIFAAGNTRSYEFTPLVDDTGACGLYATQQVVAGTATKITRVWSQNFNTGTATDDARVMMLAEASSGTGNAVEFNARAHSGSLTSASMITRIAGAMSSQWILEPVQAFFTLAAGTALVTLDANGIRNGSGIVSALNNTATTLFSAATTTGPARFEVFATINGAGAANYNAFATVTNDGGNSMRIVSNDGAALFLTLSGSNVQARHTQGTTQNITYSYLRIG